MVCVYQYWQLNINLYLKRINNIYDFIAPDVYYIFYDAWHIILHSIKLVRAVF